LLFEYVLRRQRDFLFLQPLGHGVDLGIEFGLEHQSIVDDRRNAIEHLAVYADIASLCLCVPEK
jgi:hypothetical protein